jgi:predicted double-glycine peptidase
MVVAKTFGVDVDVSLIAKLAGTTRQGTTMKGLADAAHKLGLRARGLKVSRRQLMDLKLPIIAYVNNNHFFVIDQILDDKFSITDINMEFDFMSLEEFDQIWEGYVLVVLPRRDEKSENHPNIWVDRFVYDFGVAAANLIETNFTVENTGNADLIIRDLIPGCSCTRFEISKKIIPPGEQAQLTMAFDLTGRWGETSTTAKLLSNDSNQPILTFMIKGIAKTTLAISPKSIELGRVLEGNKSKPISQKIKIRDPGTGDLKIEKVKPSSDAVRSQLFQEKKGADAVIHISIIPERCKQISPDKKFEEYVTIYTNHKESPELVVPIQGEIGPVIEVSPERFFFGFVKKGESTAKSVVVKGDEKTRWEIAKVETDSQAIVVDIIPVTPHQEYRIQAHFLTNRANSDIIKETLKLHTNHPKQPFVEIPIYAIIQ